VSAAWLTIVALALITAAIKALGPVLLGARPLPPRLMRVVILLGPAILAALVMVQTFSAGREIVLDARAGGLAAAAAALALRAPILVTIGVAAAATAGIRALS
jgi:uncharacterized membrane protein